MIVSYVALWAVIFGIFERISIELYKNNISKTFPKDIVNLSLIHYLYIYITGLLSIFDHSLIQELSVGYIIFFWFIYFGKNTVYLNKYINYPLLSMINALTLTYSNNILEPTTKITIILNKIVFVCLNLFKVQEYLFQYDN